MSTVHGVQVQSVHGTVGARPETSSTAGTVGVESGADAQPPFF